jgi:hypothetical protein
MQAPGRSGRRFVSRVNPRAAFRFLGAGMALFAMAAGLSMSVTRSVPWFTLLVAVLLVAHFWPVLRPARPALELDEEGLRLDGLGFILWEAVGRIGVRVGEADGRALSILEIDLQAPLAIAVVRPDAGPPWRRFQTRLWRAIGPQRLLVDITQLEDPAEDVRAAIAELSGRSVGGGRGFLV